MAASGADLEKIRTRYDTAREAIQGALKHKLVLDLATVASLGTEALRLEQKIADIDKQIRTAQETCAKHNWEYDYGPVHGNKTYYKCSRCGKSDWF